MSLAFLGSAQAFRDMLVMELAQRANKETEIAWKSYHTRDEHLAMAATLREFEAFLRGVIFPTDPSFYDKFAETNTDAERDAHEMTDEEKSNQWWQSNTA